MEVVIFSTSRTANPVTMRIREGIATDLFRESQTENTKLPPNTGAMAPCCYNGVLPYCRPYLKADRPTYDGRMPPTYRKSSSQEMT